MAYNIYKVTSINNGVISATSVSLNPTLDMNNGLPKKFTFVKATDLEIITDADYSILFKYKDKV